VPGVFDFRKAADGRSYELRVTLAWRAVLLAHPLTVA
jgi:hypothetical protein